MIYPSNRLGSAPVPPPSGYDAGPLGVPPGPGRAFKVVSPLFPVAAVDVGRIVGIFDIDGETPLREIALDG
ncbi:hypothetical protein GCM10010869_48330 [Mesorhizobium tianshanense]|nr:hypothetical protein GCM10010869_48330 [Mesorhizobium tianshanense]